MGPVCSTAIVTSSSVIEYNYVCLCDYNNFLYGMSFHLDLELIYLCRIELYLLYIKDFIVVMI